MAFIDSLVVFVVSALVGGLGIFVGASVIVQKGDYTHAVFTALIGALAWGVTSYLVGGIWLIGPILTLLAYLLVIKWRYGAGWIEAGGITLVAWVATVVVLAILRIVNLVPPDVLGIPGI